MGLSGYLHPGYAQSLAEFGTPIRLPRSGGWLLKRAIPGSRSVDAVGCYPFLACVDWQSLADDLADLDEDIVSVTAVPDPFGGYTLDDLRSAFPDTVTPFKDHFYVDLTGHPDEVGSRGHRRRARKALREVDVEIHERPIALLDRWMELFDSWVAAIGVTGIRAFSRTSIEDQLALPGCHMSLARHRGRDVSAHIQFIQGDTAYAHLSAKIPAAYELGADYALYQSEIAYFSSRVRQLDWGGEAGLARQGSLSAFKRGWSTASRETYLCGRIIDRQRYERLCAASKVAPDHDYFPAYRRGEFD